MANMNRRRALTVLGLAPVAAVLDAQQPTQPTPRTPHVTPNQPAGPSPQPGVASKGVRKFFNAKEYRTAKVLADDIIPRDGRSGSASEAGALEYMDFHLSLDETSTDTRTAMHGGLRWIDTESKRRFGTAYASATEAQRHQILDDISWPGKTKPEFAAGAAFFGRFRDMAAAGFFSSPTGWKDLRYEGNVFNPNWQGCPEPAMQKLGVSHALMDTRVPVGQ
jgi:hypothetical protein